MNQGYYMIRAMTSQQEELNLFFMSNIVAIGWSEVDIELYREDRSELRKETRRLYYSNKPWHKSTVSKHLNEIERFIDIKKGDLLIVPFYNSIRVAIAKSRHFYSEKSKYLDLANQLEVEYLMSNGDFKTIPRDSLSEGLQRRLRVRGSTVSDLGEFQEEIDAIFSKENYSWTSERELNEQKQLEILKKNLLSNIRNGITNLKTGGLGLENLVKELLETEGYEAKIMAKNHFMGLADGDIVATKSDKFTESKLLIQVKHHNGYTDSWGIKQLELVNDEDERYQEFKLILLTSASVSDETKEYGEKVNVNILDGIELVDWIIDKYELLSPETMYSLGLSVNPRLIE